MPIATERPRWRDAYSALRIRNYRIFASGQFVSATGLWTQRIAQDWLILELTGSITAVGIMMVLQFGPTLLFGMWGGVFVDRHTKRAIIVSSEAAACLAGAALAALTLTSTIEVWHVYALAGGLGFFAIVDQPARQVFVNELVPRETLRNAISTHSAILQLAGMAGPAAAGLLIVWIGTGWTFTVTVVASLISILSLSLLDTGSLVRTPRRPRAKGQIIEALRYARRRPAIFWTLTLLIFASTIGFGWPVLLAAMADQEFNSGAAGYGAYNAVVAAGALLGALLSMRRMNVRLRTVVGGVAAIAAFKLLAGFAPTELSLMLMIGCAGMWGVLMWTAANSLLQLSSNIVIRGRIMALYLLIGAGGQAIGGPLLGWICDVAGARVGMIVSGVVPLLAAGVIAIILARSGRLRPSIALRRGSPLLRIVPRRKPSQAHHNNKLVRTKLNKLGSGPRETSQ